MTNSRKFIFIVITGIGILLALSSCAPTSEFIAPVGSSTPLPTSPPTATATMTPTPTPLPTATPGIGSTSISPKDGMLLLYVPSGGFTMGSKEGSGNEFPDHTVFLDAFWIDRTEVTDGMYALCVAEGACQPPVNSNYYGIPEFDNNPVTNVDWNMAQAYCGWAGRRLPTEAEWEKAARGTDGRYYPWGNEAPNADLLNYGLNVGVTTAVGSYPAGASPYGALDMAGNVWEWVADWYQVDYYTLGNTSNPQGPHDGRHRVIRGGAWGIFEAGVSTSARVRYLPESSSYDVGFRCAVSP